jgi:hypothetical protein
MRLAGLILWVCACEHEWTVDAALSPTLAKMDAAADGVGADEWAGSARSAPGFETVDGDRDGTLTPAELHQWMVQADPLTFDNPISRRPPDARSLRAYFPESNEERALSDLLRFLSLELHARDPTAWIPDEDLIRMAAQSGRLDHPLVARSLSQLAAGYAGAGLTFPEGLLPEELPARP